MGYVLFIITALFVLLFALLLAPIRVVFRVERSKKVEGHVVFSWFFGLVRYRVNIPAATKSFTGSAKKGSANKKGRKPGGRNRAYWRLLQQPVFRRRVFRFIRNLAGATHARDLYIRLRIGLGDPADTGRLWGFLGPFAGIAANLPSAEIRIEPEFMAPALEIESHGGFRLIPLQILTLVTTFVLAPANLHAWRTLRRRSA